MKACANVDLKMCTFSFFSGLEYFEPRPPCDPTQIGRFRQLLGEEGVEELLSQTIQTAFKAQSRWLRTCQAV